MIALTLAEIAAITSGTVHGAPDPSAQVTAPAACDSRQVTPGGTFAALPGARADGHDFAGQALAAGAACVLASRPVDGPAVVVPDVTAALGALARHVLSQLTDATVIAMTGSSGKTTTKDMLRHVLPQHGPVIAPPGSFSTEIGLRAYTALSRNDGFPDNSTAEVISERPFVNGEPTELSDFESAYVSAASSYWNNGSAGFYGNPNRYGITMENSSGGVLATTSNLSENSNFTNTWAKCS